MQLGTVPHRWVKQGKTSPAGRRSQRVNRAWADRSGPRDESEEITIITDTGLGYVRNQVPCRFAIPLRWYNCYCVIRSISSSEHATP